MPDKDKEKQKEYQEKYREKNTGICPLCGGKMYYQSRRCKKCYTKNTRRWGRVKKS